MQEQQERENYVLQKLLLQLKEKGGQLEITLREKLELEMHIAISKTNLQELVEALGIVTKRHMYLKIMETLRKYYEKEYVTFQELQQYLSTVQSEQSDGDEQINCLRGNLEQFLLKKCLSIDQFIDYLFPGDQKIPRTRFIEMMSTT